MSRPFRVGAFSLAALILFALGIFWISSKRFLLSSTYRLEADFDNVVGLTEGAEVRVGGLDEGTVTRIQLPARSGEKIRVSMNMKSVTRGVLKKDSLVTISSEGLVGDKYVEVGFGSEGAPPVHEGDVLEAQDPVQISDLIQKANGILDSAGGAVENIESTAASLKSISGKIDQGSGTAGALINDPSLYQKATAGVTALQEDTEALKHNFLLRGFFNKRGYEDSSDLLKHAIASLPTEPPSMTFSYDAKKLFDDRETAKLKDGKAMDEAAHFLEKTPFGLAVVAGYQDFKGDSDKDRLLTQARAMVAREYLVNKFKLKDTLIKSIGLGKAPDIPDGGQIKVIVYPTGTPIPPPMASSSGKHPIESR